MNGTSPMRAGRMGVLFFLLLSLTARAATWYVDSGATGANNGTSWANAWTSISGIRGLAAGDTVYISGGPSGSTRTYGISSWAPAGGTSTSPITYQIGQDSSHNGTAIFTGSGTWITGGLINVIISGDAGDGAMHFSIAGGTSTSGTSPYSSGLNNYGQGGIVNGRLSYVNMGQINQGFFSNPCGPNAEVDHNYVFINNMAADGNSDWWGPVTGNNGYDTGLRFHDNTVFVPGHNILSTGIGEDAFDGAGDGLSIYNNTFTGYETNYTGAQHMDGFQGIQGGNYIRISNNHINTFGDIGIYVELTGSFGSATYNHVRIFNNVVENTGVDGIEIECESGGTQTFNDVVVANNVVDASTSGLHSISFVNKGSTVFFTSCLCANNVTMNQPNYIDPTVPALDNVALSSSQAASYFASYVVNNLNNDYHLKSSATSLIGQGTNLYSMCTTDLGGNARPSSGPWDIGAYIYGTGSGSGPSTNPTVSLSVNSLNFGSIKTNTTTNLTFTVRNSGGGTLSGSATTSLPFSIVSGGSYSLGSNQTQTVTVRYAPTAVSSSDSGMVTLTGGNGGSVSLSGSAWPLLGLSFPSTSGTLSGGYIVSNSFIYTTSTTTVPTAGGQAVYHVNIPTTGNYAITNNAISSDQSTKSYYINFDAPSSEPANVCDLQPPMGVATNYTVSWRGTTGTPTNDQYQPNYWYLTAGTHVLTISSREWYTFVGQISIATSNSVAQRPTPPTNIRVISSSF